MLIGPTGTAVIASLIGEHLFACLVEYTTSTTSGPIALIALNWFDTLLCRLHLDMLGNSLAALDIRGVTGLCLVVQQELHLIFACLTLR